MPSPLEAYEAFVRAHPSAVANVERVLRWVAWAPDRWVGDGEFAYEAFSAAVGLLGLYNESILSPAGNEWGLWLAAVEQVQTLVELRALQLERAGKMSRYGPLIALEALKTLLRLRLWRASKCCLALEGCSPEDTQAHESQAQLAELLQALGRLRQRYAHDEPGTAPSPEHLAWKAQHAQAWLVRAAAVAPCRPPGACAAAAAGLPPPAGPGAGRSSSCPGCSGEPAAAAVAGEPQPQRAAACSVCGASLLQAQQQRPPLQQQPGGSKPLAGLSEIEPASRPSSSCGQRLGDGSSSSSSGDSGLRGLQAGWWRRLKHRLYPSSTSSGSSSGPALPGPSSCSAGRQAAGSGSCSSWAGALPDSWGPGLRPCASPPGSQSVPGAGLFGSWLGPGQQAQAQTPWSLASRDDSIGRAVMRAGELAFVLRPLVYVCLLKRYGLSSWRPWLASLGLELASGYGLHTGHAILQHAHTAKWPPGSTLYSLALLRALSSASWTPGERQELLLRRLQLLRYLLRSPCYDALTRRLLLRLVSAARWVPGLSSLAGYGFSMVDGMQAYYSYVES